MKSNLKKLIRLVLEQDNARVPNQLVNLDKEEDEDVEEASMAAGVPGPAVPLGFTPNEDNELKTN